MEGKGKFSSLWNILTFEQNTSNYHKHTNRVTSQEQQQQKKKKRNVFYCIIKCYLEQLLVIQKNMVF